MQIIFESFMESEVEKIEKSLHNAGIRETKKDWHIVCRQDAWKVKHRLNLRPTCHEDVTRAIELWGYQHPDLSIFILEEEVM
jgi:hypothetical protein